MRTVPTGLEFKVKNFLIVALALGLFQMLSLDKLGFSFVRFCQVLKEAKGNSVNSFKALE